MTTKADRGVAYDDDEDDYDDEVQATPPPEPVLDEQLGIDFLRYGIAGFSLHEVMRNSKLSNISLPSHLRTLEHFRGEAGVFGDPMARLLVDSAVMAHIQGARLMAKAEGQPPEVAEVYWKASTRYLSETRHQILALRQYRAPVVSKQVTVVQQQNVAHGDQQVACVMTNVTPMASLPAAISDQFVTVIAEAYGSVEAITQEPRKSPEELIVESFMAAPEVREHLAMMDLAVARQFDTQSEGGIQGVGALGASVISI